MLSDAKAIVSKEMSGKMQLWYLITLHAVSVSVTLNIDSYNNTSQNEYRYMYNGDMIFEPNHFNFPSSSLERLYVKEWIRLTTHLGNINAIKNMHPLAFFSLFFIWTSLLFHLMSATGMFCFVLGGKQLIHLLYWSCQTNFWQPFIYYQS